MFWRRCHDCLGLAHSCVQSQPKATPWHPVQVNGQGASFGFHFLANSLVWLSLSDSRDVKQPALLQELCSLPKTHVVSTPCKSCSRCA